MAKTVVALVGRPNVGKSMLFNRIAGERLAVVDDKPGTTRDRLMAQAEWQGVHFDVVDTGGIDPTQLRGAQPLSLDSAEYIPQIRAQAELAARDADAILFIVDGDEGLAPADEEVARILRRHRGTGEDRASPPVLLVVNKCDSPSRRAQAVEFYRLGMGNPIPVSALHGYGIGDLLDQLVGTFRHTVDAPPDTDSGVKIAIVGRPNVGKSSLLNRILGQERVIVSPIPGTTRDAVDTHLKYHGQAITLIDTAGLRRRGSVAPGVEKYSVLRALKAMDRADVVLLLVDASEGCTAQDAHIAGWVIEKGKSVVVVVNKWDTINKTAESVTQFSQQVRETLRFLDYVPLVFVSAKTGQRVSQVIPLALRVQEERLRRIPTSEVNLLLQEALEAHAPPSKSGRRLKILYAAQVRTDPPTFLFHVNDPKLVHFSYVRFLENRLRDRYGFLGTPLRLSFRKRTSSTEAKPRRRSSARSV